MEIETKDGIVLRNIPDGTPDEAIKARIAQIRAGRGTTARPKAPIETPAFEKEAADIAGASAGDLVAAHPVTRLALGAAAPAIGLFQLGANAIGKGDGVNQHIRNLESMKERGKKALDSTAVNVAGGAGEFIGNIGSTLAMPFMRAAPAAGVGGRIAQGAGLGAAQALATPVTGEGDFLPQKTAQVGAGALLGGVLPPIVDVGTKVATGIRNVVQPHLGQRGMDLSSGRAANLVAGDKREAVIEALENTRSAVPGVNLTAGQAAVPSGSAEFAALQKLAAERNPSLYSDVGGIGAQQEAARRMAVERISKGVVERDAAETARSLEAAQKYGAAYGQQVRADPELARLSKNPYFQDALPDAIKLAKAEGITPKSDMTKFLHFVKISLDKQLGRQGDTALVNTEKKAVMDVKQSLLDWLGRKNPNYEVARSSFESASKPIDEMYLGKELGEALTSSLGNKERDTVFANAVRKAGNNVSEFTNQPVINALTPQNRTVVDAVMGDLKRNSQFDKLAQEGMKEARERSGNVVPTIPPTGMFSPIISVARGIINRAEGRASGRILDNLAEKMKDPQAVAQLMKDATPAQRKVIEAVLQASQRAAVAGTAEQF